MSNENISVGLTAANHQDRSEAVSVFKGNKWTSPTGGWLPIEKGVWNQLPDGLHLMDSGNTKQIVILRGCIVLTCNEGESGDALYPEIGDAGRWKVVATTP